MMKFNVVYHCFSRRKVFFICRVFSYSCDKATKIDPVFTCLSALITLYFLHFKVLLLQFSFCALNFKMCLLGRNRSSIEVVNNACSSVVKYLPKINASTTQRNIRTQTYQSKQYSATNIKEYMGNKIGRFLWCILSYFFQNMHKFVTF